MSVSWHADSSLEHFSSIAVYHTTTAGDPSTDMPTPSTASASAKANRNPKKSSSAAVADVDIDVDSKKTTNDLWRLALRVMCDAEGPNLVYIYTIMIF